MEKNPKKILKNCGWYIEPCHYSFPSNMKITEPGKPLQRNISETSLVAQLCINISPNAIWSFPSTTTDPVTWSGRRWNVGDIGMVLKFGWVVIHVGDGDEHAGGTGESPGEASVAGHHHQSVVLPSLSIEEGTGDDLSRWWVDCELRIATGKPIAVWKKKKTRKKIWLVFHKAACSLRL